ncbi:MAG: helix-turn-helix domain-containing protein [Clostridia bacterium]|nr:helix-turn-helix domain-containing protein [Clostridia bacterium]
MARQTIGEFLQTLRKANGYTQQEVADKLGISNKTLSSWETDRAYPDLLSIPALADLYGVTADEILRGERKNAAEREEQTGDKDKISDKYEKTALNNKFLKFNTQSYILLIPSCAAAAFIFAAMFVSLNIGIVLLVLGAIALVTAVVLQTVFYKNALISAGITEEEQLTAGQLQFKKNIKTTLFRCIKIDGAVYLGLGLLMFIIGLINDQVNKYTTTSFSGFYYVTAAVCAALGIAALVIVQRSTEKKPPRGYTEQQQVIVDKNRKLITGGILGAVISCILIATAATFFLEYTFTKTEDIYSGWANEVKTYLQTLVVEQDSELHNSYGVAPAAYCFDLPAAEDAEPYEYIDLENGFYAYYNPHSEAYVIDYQVDEDFYLNISYAAKIMIGDVTAYNVRYCALEVTDNSLHDHSGYVYYYSPEYSVELTDKNNAIYTLYATSELYIYDGLVCWLWLALSVVAVVIPTIIYITKHKKVE